MTELARLVLADWSAGRLRWTDAVAALGLAGLPALYAAAYRHGIEVRRRFADEVRLPDLAHQHRLTPAVWKANRAWHEVWFRTFERDRGLYGMSGPGHAQRRAEGFDRDTWWLIRQQLAADWNVKDMDRMQRDADADRAHLRRIRHRVVWLELSFDPLPDDPCRAVVAMWAAGETSTAMAAEILDIDAAELRDLADGLGIPITRT
ncbi:hypothetical protein [Aureimonas psammosilenae]|uniref:hypothetical protein n=1 Tax=Aureimonas psammosilenae TaxID=2495496 RepID=UPI0012608307|nr:hypothetical protein [Aureimonas psammosilenae]